VVPAYLGAVDTVLGGGQRVFPASTSPLNVSASNPTVPPPPGGSGAVVTGSGSDGRKYEIRLVNNETKDAEATKTVGDAGEKGKENRRDAGGIRDNARSTGNALAPAANTPEGMRRLAGSMDERLAAMERKLDTAKRQNMLLSTRLRQIAAAYRSSAGGGRGGMPNIGSALSGLNPSSMLPKLPGIPGLGEGMGLLSNAASARSPAGRSVIDLLGKDLPPGKAWEKGLQRYTVLANRAISAAFPEIRTIGGVRPDSLKWHPSGLALDVMIDNPSSPGGIKLGNRVLQFIMDNKNTLGMDHVIWRQRIYYPDGSSSMMEDRGGVTQNHYDHVHFSSKGGGQPSSGDRFRL